MKPSGGGHCGRVKGAGGVQGGLDTDAVVQRPSLWLLLEAQLLAVLHSSQLQIITIQRHMQISPRLSSEA